MKNQSGYKLIALDCDGTLLDDRRDIPKENVEAVRYAQEMGVSVALCSGRSKTGMELFINKLALGKNDYVIAFNGGMIYKSTENESLYERFFSVEEARDRINEINLIRDKFDLRETTDFLVYNRIYSILTERMSEYIGENARASVVDAVVAPNLAEAVDAHVFKILMAGEHDSLEIIKRELLSKSRQDINVMFSALHLLEVLPKGVLKGLGMLELGRILSIGAEEIIAVGDEANDLSMIVAAGMGCAMANGIDEVKRCAKYVTKNDNNQGGVAEVIRKFIYQ